MKLKKLTLKNFRCYEDFEIEFNDKLNVIVAENGAGKTTILDAVAIALSPFITGFDTGTSKNFKRSDARLSISENSKSVMQEMESHYPISVNAEGIFNNKNELWTRELPNGKNARTTNKEAKNLSNYAKELQYLVRSDTNDTVSLPIISFYGTDRLWNVGGKSYGKDVQRQSMSRMWGYNRALEHTSSYKAFNTWFIDESKAQYDKLINRIQNGEDITDTSIEESVALENIREAVNTCLKISEWSNLVYNSKAKEITVNHPTQGTIPVSYLSDGVRGMLAMTADIAYRCTKLNSHLDNAPKETEGIVIIDEVDLHLHPQWQQTVIASLQEAFPNIQFIVTTHSPQVLTTVSKKYVQLIGEHKSFEPKISPLARESADALAYIMNTNVKPPLEILEQIHHYEILIKEGNIETDEARNLKKILDEIGYEIPKSDLELWKFLAEQKND